MQAAVYEYLKNGGDAELILCRDDKEAFLLFNAAVLAKRKAFVLPDLRAAFGEDLRSYRSELLELINILREYYGEKSSKKVLISPIRTVIHPLPSPDLFKSITIKFAEVMDIQALKDEFLHWGYSFVDIVEDKGEVSFRGDIMDIYPVNFENAVRISFFDNQVESIRYFTCENQKSQKKELDSVVITSAIFALNGKTYENMNKNIKGLKSDGIVQDIESLGFWALDENAQDYLKTKKAAYAFKMEEEIEEAAAFYENANEKLLKSIPIIPEPLIFKDLQIAAVKSFLEFHKEQKITILAKSESLIKQNGIEVGGNISFVQSPLIVNLTSSEDVIISLNKQLPKRRKKHPSIILDELKVGDYVVHENYGIGIFRGLQNTTILGAKRDFIIVEYQGDDKLLLPVENLNVIDRYIADSGAIAVVDKLGKQSFLKLKEKTRLKLFEIAREIIDIAAKRELIEGFKIDSANAPLEEFWQSAGFIYTDDQKKSVEDILEDLNSGKVMDRLLSGDVGFGKTEVAMNALLCAAKDNFQSLFIVPTTLLCAQHYKSLVKRFENFGIRVAKIDRFTPLKEKNKILKNLKDGSLDICVGTHALLGVSCANLALVVIDEEHKFGVKQKEKLKNLRENIHMLSMSATPIPRSLNMALSSIKQYSQILTPPNDREDIRSFVKEYDEKIIKEVISRELRRGGQIFYIHNRIATIESKAKELKKILPNIKILVLHSHVSENVAEEEMIKFENKEYDVLLSTSIVESGIHLPNTNSIIIESAENFGIADLHQLRGRVGRGKNQGFCYFFVKNKETLSEAGRKRLIALESNSFLGSGSVLAYHDLEIRGGGNLIGEAQSGHIKHIGYSLYLRMLEETINELLNKTSVKNAEVEMKLGVSAYISGDLISEDRLRLELYRRLSKCMNVSEVYEIEGEIEDRFGKLDTPTSQFLSLIVIKILASSLKIKNISNYKDNITIIEENEQKSYLKSASFDDDDIIAAILSHLRERAKNISR
ncbi:MAG: transcription-repair coupling factor [Campylobacteraceae bacterium]|nr:transcription-repair coupling factor [Campylobacteraceae bacterium]